MITEHNLIEKLRRIEALYLGATTPGEKVAAGNAMERVRKTLQEVQQQEPLAVYKFKMADMWSRRLFVALLRRYGLEAYRYSGQRYTTVMSKAPKSFVDQTLWPEFQELNKVLHDYLEEVTERVIQESLHSDTSEAEVRTENNLIGEIAS